GGDRQADDTRRGQSDSEGDRRHSRPSFNVAAVPTAESTCHCTASSAPGHEVPARQGRASAEVGEPLAPAEKSQDRPIPADASVVVSLRRTKSGGPMTGMKRYVVALVVAALTGIGALLTWIFPVTAPPAEAANSATFRD